MMLLLYKDGLVVVIHTANLISLDWDQKTQGVWVSPLFPAVDKDIDVPHTNTFQDDLLEYLTAYGDGPMNYWRKCVVRHDMSAARVRIVASVPGRHTGSEKFKWGHMKVKKLLLKHGPDFNTVSSSWDLVGQFSSIGSLGNTKDQWLCGEWLRSFSACKGQTLPQERSPATLKLVFPTVENVRASLEGYRAGGSLPYSCKTAVKQPYLVDFLHQWKSDGWGRSLASPHVKSYARVSPSCNRIAWLLLTSANLSKAAWGALEKSNSQLMIRSYEIGVMALPRDQTPPCDAFLLDKGPGWSRCKDESTELAVRLPYDLPLTLYKNEDEPWLWDRSYKTRRDSNGEFWSS